MKGKRYPKLQPGIVSQRSNSGKEITDIEKDYVTYFTTVGKVATDTPP